MNKASRNSEPSGQNPKVLRAAAQVELLSAPYFLPFLVKISRETHPYEFFPRRWFESDIIMGVLRGISNATCRDTGLKTITEEKQTYFHALGHLFQWPAESIVAYMNSVEMDQRKAYRTGMDLGKNVLQERKSRKKIHELTLIRLIDDEHYRIADELKKVLTNPNLRHTFQPRDFQIAKGW